MVRSAHQAWTATSIAAAGLAAVSGSKLPTYRAMGRSRLRVERAMAEAEEEVVAEFRFDIRPISWPGRFRRAAGPDSKLAEPAQFISKTMHSQLADSFWITALSAARPLRSR